MPPSSSSSSSVPAPVRPVVEIVIKYSAAVFIFTMLLDVWPLKLLAERVTWLWGMGYLFAFYVVMMETTFLIMVLDSTQWPMQLLSHLVFEMVWIAVSINHMVVLNRIADHGSMEKARTKETYIAFLDRHGLLTFLNGIQWFLFAGKLVMVYRLPAFLSHVTQADIEAGNNQVEMQSAGNTIDAGNAGSGETGTTTTVPEESAGNISTDNTGEAAVPVMVQSAGNTGDDNAGHDAGNAGSGETGTTTTVPEQSAGDTPPTSPYADAPDILSTPSPSPPWPRPTY